MSIHFSLFFFCRCYASHQIIVSIKNTCDNVENANNRTNLVAFKYACCNSYDYCNLDMKLIYTPEGKKSILPKTRGISNKACKQEKKKRKKRIMNNWCLNYDRINIKYKLDLIGFNIIFILGRPKISFLMCWIISIQKVIQFHFFFFN